MNLASPDNVIKHFYPNWSIDEMLGLNFNRLTAAEESSGFRSISYLGNMGTYIFLIILGAAMTVILVILFFGCKLRIKKWIKAKLVSIKESYFTSLNKTIKAVHLSYLDSTIKY